MKSYTLPALIAGALLLTACADGKYEPQVLDDSFGQTARHMVKAQIADPQAAENPPADSPRKMDGYAGVNVMRGYRQSFGGEIETQGININIGTVGGSSSGGQ